MAIEFAPRCSRFVEFELANKADDLLKKGHPYCLEKWFIKPQTMASIESGRFNREIMAPSEIGEKVVTDLFPSGYTLAYLMPFHSNIRSCLIRPIRYSQSMLYLHPSKVFRLHVREMVALFPDLWVPRLDKEIVDI